MKVSRVDRVAVGKRCRARLCGTLLVLPNILFCNVMAAPQEIAPLVGFVHWWHVDHPYADPQSFCNALLGEHAGGHPLHPAPAGCMDTGNYYPRVAQLPSSAVANFPWTGNTPPASSVMCVGSYPPGDRPEACGARSLDVGGSYHAYCPIGYDFQYPAGVWSSSPPVGYHATPNYFHANGLDKIFWSTVIGYSTYPPPPGEVISCVRTPSASGVDSNKHAPKSSCGAGAIHPGDAIATQSESDYIDPVGTLSFKRVFSSGALLGDFLVASSAVSVGAPVGRSRAPKWRSNFERAVRVWQANGIATAWVVRGDGRAHAFSTSGSSWLPEQDVLDRLSGSASSGWTYYDAANQEVESYDAIGQLLSIRGRDGKVLRVSYADGSGGFAPSGTPACLLPAGAPPPAAAPAAGLLQCVSDQSGRQVNFQYDFLRRLSKLIDPLGQLYGYAYDESSSVVLSGQLLGNNLTSVTYPNGLKRIYHYNEQEHTGGTNRPNALTGISDEIAAGQIVRYGIYQYDSQGRAISTEHAGSVNRYTVNYVTPYQQSIVTDPLGTQRAYNFSTILGVVKQTSVNQPAGAGSAACSDSLSYDAQGNVTSRTDFTARKACYANDLTRNLETARVEGLVSTDACPANVATYTPVTGTAQRKVLTQWHPDWRLEGRRSEPKKITTSVYNGQPDPTAGSAIVTCAPSTALVDGKPVAVLCRSIEQATSDETGAQGFAATAVGTARITNRTYNQSGQVLTHNGPRTDVSDLTTYEYYPDTQADWTLGDLKQITNALGQVTRFTRYDRNGQLLESLDANNSKTEHTYSPRGWLTQTKVTPAGGGATQISTYEYDGVGQLKKATAPDGSFVVYTYDAAHRLTQVDDSAGNRVEYTLDAMGNRTREDWKDNTGALRKTLTRTIDALNRAQQVVGGAQ